MFLKIVLDSSFESREKLLGEKVEKIGTEFNPFYAEKGENKEILNQVFVPVLQKNSDNSLKNY